MGYACPVCEDPQADGEHLANHLAFTAMLGDDDHAVWLDEHAPDWGDCDPPELADRVTDEVAETEFPQVFEDTTGGEHGHEHAHGQRENPGHPHAHEQNPGDALDGAPGGVADVGEALGADDAERTPEEVLAEARELTRQRRTDGTDDATETADDGGDPADDGGDTADE